MSILACWAETPVSIQYTISASKTKTLLTMWVGGLRTADLQRLHFRAPGRVSGPGWSQLLHIYLVLAWLRSQESRAGRNYPSDDGGWWGHFKTHSSGYFNIAKCFRQLGTFLQICWCVSVSTYSCVHESALRRSFQCNKIIWVSNRR